MFIYQKQPPTASQLEFNKLRKKTFNQHHFLKSQEAELARTDICEYAIISQNVTFSIPVLFQSLKLNI